MRNRIAWSVVLVWLTLHSNAQPATQALERVSYDFVVTPDGSGDFRTLQEAFNAVPDFRKKETRILLRRGTYKEKLTLATSKINVRLIGEDVTRTIVTYDDYASKKNRFGEEMGTTGSSSFFVFADDFYAENITFENSAGPVGQAVAVRIAGDRVMFRNCRFLGNQDTLYPFGEKSRQYYRDCYIEGTVDFIFGWSTAIFDHCTIFCKKPGGYVTAASTLENTRHGFVFLDCNITGDASEGTFYLGRPWRPWAKTVFIRCYLGKQIKKEGWHNWDKPDAEKTAYYAEYASTGPGASGNTRVSWAHTLTVGEAANYSVEAILGDWKISVP
ncbi:pectinesterase family protein [Parachryseolinea silvisoli]|uniref:pectinesterase family protein n=1 Tax=Parachryseolinea silvisoli TaxID=2873601 RepID=UPI0022657EC5|nr:pectinesterase family protein [Parachryseolinea silvisoli]MCD9014632.1 pectin esterase [Parachryseolinea silvisoli]